MELAVCCVGLKQSCAFSLRGIGGEHLEMPAEDNIGIVGLAEGLLLIAVVDEALGFAIAGINLVLNADFDGDADALLDLLA